MPISSGSQPATAMPRYIPSGSRLRWLASLASINRKRCAVGELRGVARGEERARLLEMQPFHENGLERREAVERGVGADAPSCLRVTALSETAPVALSTTFITVAKGAISASKRPAVTLAAARACDCAPYSSCRSREIL